MKVFVGGIAAAFLGVVGVLVFHEAFFNILAGAIPLMLLLGGGMAAYLGYDEVKDKLPFPKKSEEAAASTESETKLKEEAEKYRQEAEKLRAELEKTKAGS
ncbi:MAG: hypothetical protein AB2L11_01460 [Syntrophobacteraceae bacterium]